MVLKLLAVLACSLVITGCATAPRSSAARAALVDEAQAAIARMKATDPSFEETLDRSYAYAMFPSVGKGGWWIGAAYGRGVVYEQGRHTGYADLSQGTIGFQLGGQSYAELLAFESEGAFERFKAGQLELAAQASAVALKAGAAAATNFKNGVAIFTQTNAGLMYEASIGGQKFSFVATEE
jgi:lipid-binding SYLF domain-containing protein